MSNNKNTVQLDSIKREKEYTNLLYQLICGDYHRILNIYSSIYLLENDY